jgi:hypothetical protein
MKNISVNLVQPKGTCETACVDITAESTSGTTMQKRIDISGNAISAAWWGIRLMTQALNEMEGGE